jgi:hypothetical protein
MILIAVGPSTLSTAKKSATTLSRFPVRRHRLSLSLYAGIHVRIWGFHRMLARRFPCAIYYRVEADVCTVWRVLDCRQRPSKLRKELSTSK